MYMSRYCQDGTLGDRRDVRHSSTGGSACAPPPERAPVTLPELAPPFVSGLRGERQPSFEMPGAQCNGPLCQGVLQDFPDQLGDRLARGRCSAGKGLTQGDVGSHGEDCVMYAS